MIGVDQVRELTAHKDDATSSSSSSSAEEHCQNISCNDIEYEDNTQVIDDGGYTQKAKQCKISKNKSSSNQHIPLYTSFLCAITALLLSIITHNSTTFVTLTDPLNAGPFFKSINEVGLNYWKLCSIKQNGLDFILDHEKIISSGDEDYEVVESSDIIKEGPRGPYIEINQDDDVSNKEKIMQDGSGQRLELPPSISFIRTAHDIVRNVTSTVQTTYHNSNSIQQQQEGDWYSEPNHDDILVSGDYPYHDDDYLYESSTISNEEIYWNCHTLHFTSKSNQLDTMWNIARMFEMLGILFGSCATLLLGLLIIRRSGFNNQVDGRRWHNCISSRMKIRSSDECILDRRSSSASEQHHYQQTTPFKANNLLKLDTNTTGYRPISILFLLSYLLQSLTLLFLDSNICREQVCTLSSGAHMLLVSCVLWIVCGLLMLFMMKRVMKNKRRVRRYRRRMIQSSGNKDECVEEEDVKCLIPNSSTPAEEEEEVEDGKKRNEVLDTTTDTDYS